MRRRALTLWFRALARLGLVPIMLACVPERPACSQAELARIESAYVAETLAACMDYATPDACPAYPAIREKRDAASEAWRVCR